MTKTSNWGVFSLTIFLAACGASATGSDTSAGTGTSTGSDTGTVITGTNTNTEDVSAVLTGLVSDTSGRPLNAVDIRFCRGAVCRVFETGTDGLYQFSEVATEAWFSLEMVGPEGSGLATSLAPVTFAVDQARNVDIILPTLDAASPLGASSTPTEMGDGLWVTIGLSDLDTPLLAPDATEVAGVLLTPDLYLPVDGVTGTVAAMWHTAPFDYHAPNGLPVAINANATGLTGGPYTLYVSSYTDSTWIEVGPLTDDGNGMLTTTGTLPLLSTIMVIE